MFFTFRFLQIADAFLQPEISWALLQSDDLKSDLQRVILSMATKGPPDDVTEMAENTFADSRFGEQVRLTESQTYTDSGLSAEGGTTSPSGKTDEEVIFPNGGIKFFYWTAAVLAVLAICIQIGLHTFWEDPELRDEEKIQKCNKELTRMHDYAKQVARVAACARLEEEFVRKYNFEPE